MSKAAPIVISLKKRAGLSHDSDDEDVKGEKDASNVRSPSSSPAPAREDSASPAPARKPAAKAAARGRSTSGSAARSEAGSARESSASPAKKEKEDEEPKRAKGKSPQPKAKRSKAPVAANGAASEVGGFGNLSSPLDVAALADLVKGFHEQVASFVRRKTESLSADEAQSQEAKRTVEEGRDTIRSFLEEFGPEGGVPDPDEGSGDENGNSKHKSAEKTAAEEYQKGAKQLVRFATDDKQALQDAGDLMGTFVERHFKGVKELKGLLDKPHPVPLLKALLKLLVAELKAGQKDKGGNAKKQNGSDRVGKCDKDRSRSRGKRNVVEKCEKNRSRSRDDRGAKDRGRQDREGVGKDR